MTKEEKKALIVQMKLAKKLLMNWHPYIRRGAISISRNIRSFSMK